MQFHVSYLVCTGTYTRQKSVVLASITYAHLEMWGARCGGYPVGLNIHLSFRVWVYSSSSTAAVYGSTRSASMLSPRKIRRISPLIPVSYHTRTLVPDSRIREFGSDTTAALIIKDRHKLPGEFYSLRFCSRHLLIRDVHPA